MESPQPFRGCIGTMNLPSRKSLEINPTFVRFMESLHGLPTAHWDHEPVQTGKRSTSNAQRSTFKGLWLRFASFFERWTLDVGR